MKTKTRKWFRGLVGGIIGSAASQVANIVGLGAANAIGIDIKPLDLKQLGTVFVTGAVMGAVLFLKQSPVPPEDEGTP